MKRVLAAVALLAAVTVLVKLTAKGPDRPAPLAPVEAAPGPPQVDPVDVFTARYPAKAALVKRVVETYRHNAVAVEQTDGIRGLALLDALGVEAVYLYEKHPAEFRTLRDALNDAAAADVLLHWREYFGWKHADDADRRVLVAELARLAPSARKVAAAHPSLLPLLLAEPAGVSDLVARWTGEPKDLEDALSLLGFISLDAGGDDLRKALRTLDSQGRLALEAFRVQGLDGFALVSLYGPLLAEIGAALPLEKALIVVRVNADAVDDLSRTHAPGFVAAHIRHAAAAGLVEAVGGSPHGLRLLVEYGDVGERALKAAGADAAEVAYDDFPDPVARAQAVAAIAEHGAMALAILDKYAAEPDFLEILRRYGPAVVPPIAAVDASPETLALLRGKAKLTWKEWAAKGVLSMSSDNGQATIALIKKSGLARVAELNSTEIQAYQFLPLYDLVHLGSVLGRGHAPTSGELTWALVDGCFVVLDALSLSALQPEGAAAAEAAHSEIKAATRETAKLVGRGAVEGLAVRASKWRAVRAAGGAYRLLGRVPEAMARMTLPEIAAMGRSLCTRAGLRLSTWSPVRFLVAGVEVVKRIPPERGAKYVGVQLLQAGVGVVGVRKMEEFLKSRRGNSP